MSHHHRVGIIAFGLCFAACQSNDPGETPSQSQDGHGGIEAGGFAGSFGYGGRTGTSGHGGDSISSGGKGFFDGTGGSGMPPPLDVGAIESAKVPPPPVAGGTLAVARWDDRTIAVLSDPDGDRVFLADLDARKIIRTISLQTGDEPGRVVVDGPGGRAFVALRRGGAVLVIDEKERILRRVPVCAAPRGLDQDPASKTLTVACRDGELVTLPYAGVGLVHTVHLPPDLRDVVVRPDGTKLVSHFRSANVSVVDANGDVTETASPFSPAGFAPAVAWRMIATPGGAMVVHQRAATTSVAISPPGGYGSSGCSTIV